MMHFFGAPCMFLAAKETSFESGWYEQLVTLMPKDVLQI